MIRSNLEFLQKSSWQSLKGSPESLPTVGELKDLTLHRTLVVKLPLLRAVSVGHE